MLPLFCCQIESYSPVAGYMENLRNLLWMDGNGLYYTGNQERPRPLFGVPKWPDPSPSQTWSFLSASGRSLKPFASCTSAPETQKSAESESVGRSADNICWLVFLVESPESRELINLQGWKLTLSLWHLCHVVIYIYICNIYIYTIIYIYIL